MLFNRKFSPLSLPNEMTHYISYHYELVYNRYKQEKWDDAIQHVFTLTYKGTNIMYIRYSFYNDECHIEIAPYVLPLLYEDVYGQVVYKSNNVETLDELARATRDMLQEIGITGLNK